MKVFLATQVVSSTVVKLIDMHVDKCGGVTKYNPLKAIIQKVDHLVNICNNTRVNNRGVVKGCKEINTPTHYHLIELIEIL